MPPRPQPARLWLRPADENREAVWCIVDGRRRISTSRGPSARGEAEKCLADYIAGKHDPAAFRCRPAHQTLIADVLSVYLDNVVGAKVRPPRVLARIARLIEWWGAKTIADISAATCRQYAAERTQGGARRDLEDLRAAIAYHATRGLHTGKAEIELPEKGKPRTRYFTRDEVARAVWYCWRHKRKQRPPRGRRKGELVESDFHDLRHIARFLLIGVYTGSRSAPILRASPYAASGRAFVDLESGIYYRLPEDMEQSDTKRSPTCRLPDGILAHMRRWKRKGLMRQFFVEFDGKPVKSIKTGWKTMVDGAKLDGRPTPHTTRHTCVTWQKQAGVPSFEVAGFVGMSEAMVDRVYGHHDPAFQNRARSSFGAHRR